MVPYVALRRTTLAILHVLHEEASRPHPHRSSGVGSSEGGGSRGDRGDGGRDRKDSKDSSDGGSGERDSISSSNGAVLCRRAIAEVAPLMLLAFAGMLNCSRASRAAVELLHISKVCPQTWYHACLPYPMCV